MTLFRHGRGRFRVDKLAKDTSGMEFITIRDGDDHLFLSKEVLNHGDFTFRYAIKAFDMADYVGVEEVGAESPLHIELYVVSPEAAGEDNIKQAFESWGMPVPDPADDSEMSAEQRDLMICEVLLSYGTAAGIYSLVGGHARVFDNGWWEELPNVDLDEELTQGVDLMKQHATAVGCLFGFYMDAALNAIGNTGWDWVAGKIGFG